MTCRWRIIRYRRRPSDYGCACGWMLDMSTPVMEVFEVYAQHVLEKYIRDNE